MERMMIKKKDPAPEYLKSPTAVWWDINRCPIPDGYDARRVGPRIDTVLMSLGYSGPLTITAIGDLEGTPVEVLRALSSTGILLRDVACGLMSISLDMLAWEKKNHPPATIMLISDYAGVATFSHSLGRLQWRGYNILMAYPHTLPRRPSGLVTSAEWLWEAFLTDAMDSENIQEKRRPEKKCSEAMFLCQSCTCDFASQSFETFICHLRCTEHAVKSFKPKVPAKVEFFKDGRTSTGNYVPVYDHHARPRKVIPKYEPSSTSKAVECSLPSSSTSKVTSQLRKILPATEYVKKKWTTLHP